MTSAAAAQTAPILAADFRPSILPVLAHELRQPLSAMESIAYYLDLVMDRADHRAREHASRLHGLVAQSNWILSCALELATDRALAPVLVDLEELITQTISAHTLPGEIGPELRFRENLPLVLLDPARSRTFMENLLAMFTRLTTDAHRVRLITSCDADSRVVLELAVAVPGYTSELALGAGIALGMQSLRRFVETHGGTLHLSVNAITGVRARVELPVANVAAMA